MTYRRVALLRKGRASSREVCKARRSFQRELQEDRRQRVQAEGSDIEGLMANVRVKEVWDHLVMWYYNTQGKKAQPIREGLDQDSEVREELYRCQPPARIKVPVLV